MAVRSYVDLAYFVCVMHADPASVPADLRDAFETEGDGALQHLLFDRARSLLDRDIYLHECIHLWQGLNLPFVYWSSFRAFQGILKTFRVFNRYFPDLHDWKGPTPGILRLLSETLYPYVSTREIELHMRDKGERIGYKRLAPFSPIALLETAASVTQWRLSRPPRTSLALSFSRWTKREGGYRRMVDYLASIVEDEDLALDMYLPLCNAAFRTSNPVSAFVTGAYQYVAKHAPNLQTHANTYRNRIACLFREINDDARDMRPQEPRQLSELDVSLVDLPSFNLTMPDVLELTFGESKWPHPTLHTLARRWRDEARSCAEMRNLLDDPAQASDATVERLLDSYRPMMLIRYASPTRVRVVPILRQGDYDYVSRVERVAPAADGPTALRDLYTIFGLIRRAVGIYYDEGTRLCNQGQCPEFGHNYCNTWMFVPKNYPDCSFLDNVSYIRKTMREAEEEDHGSEDHSD